MRLATVFKTAAVCTGFTLSALGSTAFLSHERYSNEENQAWCDKGAAKDKFAMASGGAFFFAGTTLIAIGLRRKKGPKA